MFYLLVMEEVEIWEQGDKFEILLSFSSRLALIDTPILLFNSISFEKEREGLMLIFLDINFIYNFCFINKFISNENNYQFINFSLFLIKLFFYKFLFIN